MKKLLRTSLRVLISASLLVYLLSRIDLSQIGGVLAGVRVVWLVGALGVFIGVQILLAFRWAVLLRSRGVRLPLLRAIQLNLIGAFFNSFLPSTVGGDAVRGIHLARLGNKGADSAASIMIERVLGLAALAILGTVGCVLYYDLIRGTGAITAMVVIWVLIGGVVLVFYTSSVWQRLLRRFVRPRRGGRLKSFTSKLNALHDSAVGFRSSPGTLLAGLGLSLVAKFISAALLAFLIASAIDVNIRIGYFIVFGPIKQCILMVPISVQGIGVREAASVFFYTQAGMTEAQALSFGLLGYALMLFFSGIGGLVYALSAMPTLGKSSTPIARS
jgi:glycosyltransferase 2 family protein